MTTANEALKANTTERHVLPMRERTMATEPPTIDGPLLAMVLLAIASIMGDLLARWYPRVGYGVMTVGVVGMCVCLWHSWGDEEKSFFEKAMPVILFLIFVAGAFLFGWWVRGIIGEMTDG